ncbi:hypothetical protein QQ045_009355 [Rhodiola kirilowii]
MATSECLNIYQHFSCYILNAVRLESKSLTVCFDVMVESVESASAEIDLASIDVTDKSDSAVATGVFGNGDLCLDVSPIDSTQAEDSEKDVLVWEQVAKFFKEYLIFACVEDGSSLIANDVILTVSLGVLEVNLILFELLSLEWKTTAIFHLSVRNEDQVGLKFSDVYWPNWKFLGMVASISYVCGYFLNHHKATSQFVIAYMVAGRFAYDMENLFSEHIVKFPFDMLHPAKISVNAIELLQRRYHVSQWKVDLISIGCYCFGLQGVVFIFNSEPVKLIYDIITINAIVTECTSPTNSSVIFGDAYKFLNDNVTMIVVT